MGEEGNGVFAISGQQNGTIKGRRDGTRSLSITSYTSELNADLRCGYGRFTPKVLQVVHNARCLLTCLCFCSITQGMLINGLIPVSITSLEKRFQLTSTQSGLYSSMYDIAVLIALVPVCHFGGKGHKGQWLGLGMLIMGLGSFICALPQFVTGPYQYGQSVNNTCTNISTVASINSSKTLDPTCSASQDSYYMRNYFYVLLFGQLLNGFGAAPLYTLGITYIDENVAQKSSPLYLGIYFAFSVVGPALGFVLGGIFLKIYGDVGKVDVRKVTLNSNDPSWYGAWWLGMVLTAILSVLFSIPLLGFARELPEAKKHRKHDINQTNAAVKAQPVFGDDLTALPKSCSALLKNKTYVCLIFMKCAEAFLMNGMVTFIPKLVENLFSVSSSVASLITGAVVVPGGFLGNLLGGYIIKRFKLRVAGTILLACSFNCVGLCLILSMLIYCPEVRFVGVNERNSESISSINVADTCNAACSCPNYYSPVCHQATNRVFYSPCHAGCSSQLVSKDDKQQYSSCACLSSNKSIDLNDPSNVVFQGLCETGCNLMPVFLVIFGFQVLVTFMSAMPIQQVELRCVPFKQRTLAVGLSWVFVRILGAIPGAILFGIAIDGSCALWHVECGESKSCIRYTSRKMALSIMGFGLSFKCAIIIFLLLAWKFYQAPEDEDEHEMKNGSAGGAVKLQSGKVAPVSDYSNVIRL